MKTNEVKRETDAQIAAMREQQEKTRVGAQAYLDSLSAAQEKWLARLDSVNAARGELIAYVDSLRSVLADEFRVTFVHPGESLWQISRQFMGSPHRWPELYAWNVWMIGNNPDLIHPLMRLDLPPDSLDWKIEPASWNRDGGWVVEFVHVDTSQYRFYVGVMRVQ
jgi:nucleoid-associated protein YgaU